MLRLLRERLPEVLRAIAPLVGVVCVLQVTVVHAPLAQFLQFLAGSFVAALGMLLLFAGIDLGVVPMGRFIGAELPRKGSRTLILAVAAAMGFATTVAEPDVLILGAQVEEASQGALSAVFLVYVIAAGVGLFAAVALLRIVYGVPITWLIAGAYALMLVLSLSAPERIVALAYDAGSVTTGVLTAPVLLALALGLSAVLARRSAALDGFGLLGFASVGPIIILLVLGLLQ
jgi:hypothetical protein